MQWYYQSLTVWKEEAILVVDQSDISFLQDAFKKYYYANFDKITALTRSHEREYGYQKFDSGMIRHISIPDDKKLHIMLMENTPSDVYCSNAYYTFPDRPMNEKIWKEADLIFDIDAKDLSLPCRADHTISICSDCNRVLKHSKSCDKCNSTKLDNKSLPCKKCIAASKNEVSKLVDILTADLGVNQTDIYVYFSGNEGFHIYVYNSQFQPIGAKERQELVDYITLRGAIPETFGMKRTSKTKRDDLPDFDQVGWRSRFSEHVYGAKSKRPKKIKELIADGYPNFQKTLNDDVAPSIGVKIDPNVTQDISRIFRLPGSLNSKSGLSKIRCDIDDMSNFNPFTDASLLSDDTVEVVASTPIAFKLQNKTFGPYDDEQITVPTYAAVYMACKKMAKIA